MATNFSADTESIAGEATLAGTERYTEKFGELHPSHFRFNHNLFFPSIGLGTYLGDATDKADADYSKSIMRAVSSGSNLIDTAINYRFQRSERAVGQALKKLVANGFSRDEIIVCSKGGFIPFDGALPADPYQWIEDNLIKKAIVTPEEIHPSGHCMSPMYLYTQIEKSKRNLGVEKIDIYYLHNPETQMSDLNEVRFYEALEMAFSALEAAVRDGHIAMYGVATWDGFLDTPGSRHLMQLERVVDAARRAGGEQHNLCMVQLPVNLAMPEAITSANQKVNNRKLTLLEAAQAFNLGVIASASLLQGELANNLPITLSQAIPGMSTDAARALQFTRSISGITSALVGMGTPDHVTANMELAHGPVMTEDEFNILFGER